MCHGHAETVLFLRIAHCIIIVSMFVVTSPSCRDLSSVLCRFNEFLVDSKLIRSPLFDLKQNLIETESITSRYNEVSFVRLQKAASVKALY